MELLHSRKKNVAFFSLIFALTATTALLAALGSKDVFIVKAASDKTLTITPSTNLFVGDTPIAGSENNYKNPSLFSDLSPATSTQSKIIGAFFTTPDVVISSVGTYSFPTPQIGNSAATATYIARSSFGALFDLTGDSVYASFMTFEVGLRNITSVKATFSVDVSALGGTEGTDYSTENLSTIKPYILDYSNTVSDANLPSGYALDFDATQPYNWALITLEIKLTIPAENTAPSTDNLAKCFVNLTNLVFTWSC